jgi:hypothetical protein
MTLPEDPSFTDPAVWLSPNPVIVPVRGASMVPFLTDGDRVEVVLGERASFGRGDLILFQRGDEVVVHRFLASAGGRFLEKGDGQARGNWADWPPCPGLVVAFWREGLRVDLARSPWPEQMASLGRAHHRAHRIALLAERLPGTLPGRILNRLGRILGLLPS